MKRLCAPAPSYLMFKGLYFSNAICALLHHVFIRFYSIHLNTCSHVNVYTRTVQSTLKEYMCTIECKIKYMFMHTYVYIYNAHKPLKMIKIT